MRAPLLSIFSFWSFFVIAQKSDTSARYKEMVRMKNDWFLTSLTDSQFVADHSENPATLHHYHAGSFPAGTETRLLQAKDGEIIGPVEDGNACAIYKRKGSEKRFDSVQVSHILYSYVGARGIGPSMSVHRSKEQAKKSADSLCELIRSGKVLLENVVEKVTDDPGSKNGNKGNYGWFTRESGFVDGYKAAAFGNPVGSTVVAETEFGYHIIQVEVASRVWDCIAAWEIVKAIDTCYDVRGISRSFAMTYPGGMPAYYHDFDSIAKYYPELMAFEPSHPVYVSITVASDSSVVSVQVNSYQHISHEVRESIIGVHQRMRFIPDHDCEHINMFSFTTLKPFERP